MVLRVSVSRQTLRYVLRSGEEGRRQVLLGRKKHGFGAGHWPGASAELAQRGRLTDMPTTPLLQKLDAVTIPVPDLDAGLRFYRDCLGHQLRWRNDSIGAAGLGLPGSDTEIVLTTQHRYEPNWPVTSADQAAAAIAAGGGRMVAEPVDIPVGPVAVVADPFGNPLVLLDLSKGHYVTDILGNVTVVEP